MCLCVCVCVLLRLCVHMHVWQRVSLSAVLFSFLKQGISLNWKLTSSAGLQALGSMIFFFYSFKCGCLGSVQVLTLAWQTLSSLRHLPAPKGMVLRQACLSPPSELYTSFKALITSLPLSCWYPTSLPGLTVYSSLNPG